MRPSKRRLLRGFRLLALLHVDLTRGVPSGLATNETVAQNRQSTLSLKSSPVDRILARKMESIEAATRELEKAKAPKENLERFFTILEPCQYGENATYR